MRLVLPCLLGLALSACGRYADFTLPPATGNPAVASFGWQPAPDPVLVPAAGTWESVDVLNPSVVRRGGELYNFYSGYDGKTWHTGLATSRDGLSWIRQGRMLSPNPDTWEGTYIAANGAALWDGRQFLYWYHSGPRTLPAIGLARSPDGKSWEREPAAVLAPGPRGSWDERGVADPYVLQARGVFYLYYLGQDRARRQRIGLARSSDGIVWEKLRSNPLLELGGHDAFDGKGLGEPAVWQSDGAWWMLYTGRDQGERRRMGLARSLDGVHWTRLPSVFAGTENWNREVICDASVLVEDGQVRVWFGGGNRASPDENLNGRIGIASLVPLRQEGSNR